MTTGQRSSGARLVSLDVFRGATILGMIIVNNPGTWASVYPPLLHAPWHGWTPTDLIFPFFLFIVGVAVVLAYSRRLERGDSRSDLLRKAIVRSVVLFALGLFMAAWPFITLDPFGLRPALETLRVMGVLQRIALCYLTVSLLVLYTSARTQGVVLIGLLLGYWVLMTVVPVPGFGAGALDIPDGTLAAYVDRAVFGDHLWVGADRRWDPEGLLSTLPAVATTLFGVWAGRLILETRPIRSSVLVRLFVAGVSLVALGYVWGWVFPINKSLWTSSYAVLTAGQAMCALGVCIWVFEMREGGRWAQPFVVYGMNAITVFVLSGLLAKLLIVIRVRTPGGETSLQGWIFTRLFEPLASTINASLLYALTWVAMWWLVLTVMHRRKLFIKV